MSDSEHDANIATHAALVKLSRVLGADRADVAFLTAVDLATLRELRELCAARLHDADAERLQAVAASGRLLPVGIAASIGQRFFGPTLVARLIGLFEPERGANYARHVSTDFMADVAVLADPSVISRVAEHLELATLQEITKVLVARDDVVTLSHFVGPLPASTIADILAAVDDHATVVRIALYVEDLSALDPIVACLSDERLGDVILAVRDAEIWDDAMHLFGHLTQGQVARVVTLVANLTDVPAGTRERVNSLRQ